MTNPTPYIPNSANLANRGDYRQGASLVGYTLNARGAVGSSVHDVLSECISVKRFGAQGDGATDDTAAIQAGINAAAESSKVLFIPSGYYKITRGLTTPTNFAGLIGEGMACTKIIPYGSGYTALTVSTGIAYRDFQIDGEGRTLNGILFAGLGADNGGFCAWLQVENIRCVNFDGYALKCRAVFDSNFHRINIESSGNATEYAFSLLRATDAAGDHCNQSVFSGLQVELSNKKAIYVHPDTLSCTFEQIHSERATADALYTTWVLGGTECTYTNARLTKEGVTGGTALLYGADSQFIGLYVEDGIDVTATPNTAGGIHSALLLLNPLVQDNLIVSDTTGTGTVEIHAPDIRGELQLLHGECITYGGYIATINGNVATVSAQLSKIATKAGATSGPNGFTTIKAATIV
jgi:hypothetical protein